MMTIEIEAKNEFEILLYRNRLLFLMECSDALNNLFESSKLVSGEESRILEGGLISKLNFIFDANKHRICWSITFQSDCFALYIDQEIQLHFTTQNGISTCNKPFHKEDIECIAKFIFPNLMVLRRIAREMDKRPIERIFFSDEDIRQSRLVKGFIFLMKQGLQSKEILQQANSVYIVGRKTDLIINLKSRNNASYELVSATVYHPDMDTEQLRASTILLKRDGLSRSGVGALESLEAMLINGEK